MHPTVEDDLFYDLFGEEGFRSPESPGSTDQDDSGHGSPLEPSFEHHSPPLWDAKDIWGSILDGLPSDITDEIDTTAEKRPLHDGFANSRLNTVTNSYTEASSWTTNVLDRSNGFNLPHDLKVLDQGNNGFDLSRDFYDGWRIYSGDKMKQEPLHIDCSETNHSALPSMQTRHHVTYSLPSQYSYARKEDEIEIAVMDTSEISNKGSVPKWIVRTCPQNGCTIVENTEDNNGDNNGDSIVEVDIKAYTDVDSISITSSESKEYVKDILLSDEGNTGSPVHHNDHDYTDKGLSDAEPTTGISHGLGPQLNLTDEEKSLLEKECQSMPECGFLTKEEEKALKRVRRKIKNKRSAMESRKRRKIYMENIERRLVHCTDLNNGLKKKVDKLSKENETLAKQLKVAKGILAATFRQTTGGTTTRTGTYLAVFILSFSLCILPFDPLRYFEGKSGKMTTEFLSSSPPTSFRSRSLLAIDDNTDYNYPDVNPVYSIPYDRYTYDENVRFENIEGADVEYTAKTNITMYVEQNFTWHRRTFIENRSPRNVVQWTSAESEQRLSTPIGSQLRPTSCYTNQHARTPSVSN